MKHLVVVVVGLLVASQVAASDLSRITGVDINLGNGTVSVAPPDLGHIPTAIGNLPQSIADIPGAPLAQAIRWAKARAEASAQPIPYHVRQQLAPYISASTLGRVRYSSDWGAAVNGTLQQFALGNNHAAAITLDNIVVFRDGRLAGDLALWVHELAHVEQYSRMGIDGFANRYTQAHWTLENEATDRANQFTAAYRRPGGPSGGGPVPVQQGAYFWINGGFFFGDQGAVLYPADPNTGRVVGPARGRMTMQNGMYVAYDSMGMAYSAVRVR
jgi:hypothetical protein